MSHASRSIKTATFLPATATAPSSFGHEVQSLHLIRSFEFSFYFSIVCFLCFFFFCYLSFYIVILGTNTIARVVRNLHEGSIFSICVLKNGNIITGGGKDGRIVYFDSSLNLAGSEAQASRTKISLLKRNVYSRNFSTRNFVRKRVLFLIDRRSFRRNQNAVGRKRQSAVGRHYEKLHTSWRHGDGLQSGHVGPRRGSLGTRGSSNFATIRDRGTRQVVADVGQSEPHCGLEQRHRGM